MDSHRFTDKFIQTEKHDSIEDARTALSLYKYYLEYIVGANKATQLSRLYERGRSMSWSVPDPSTRLANNNWNKITISLSLSLSLYLSYLSLPATPTLWK